MTAPCAKAIRWVIVDRPTDKESNYQCECGFNEYLGEMCGCGNCKQYELPLERCPVCGEQFEVRE